MAEAAVSALGWQAPWKLISSVTRSGTDTLMQEVSDALQEMVEDERQAAALAENHE